MKRVLAAVLSLLLATGAWGQCVLRQSTAETIVLGPFVDRNDGRTPEVGLAANATRLSKDGGAFAAGPVLGAHDENGDYSYVLASGNTDTLGILKIQVTNTTVHLPLSKECRVLTANVYDAFYAGTDNLDVNLALWLETAPLALVSQRPQVEVDAYDGSVDFNATQKASVNAEVDTGLVDYDATVPGDFAFSGTAVQCDVQQWDAFVMAGAGMVEDDVGNSRWTTQALEQAGGTGTTPAAVWAYATRILTALDEDDTTIDLDASTIGIAAVCSALTGHTNQTADHTAGIAALQADLDLYDTDAERRVAQDAALAAYDGPTHAELIARIPGLLLDTTVASVIDQTNITVAAAITYDEQYNNTEMIIYDVNDNNEPCITRRPRNTIAATNEIEFDSPSPPNKWDTSCPFTVEVGDRVVLMSYPGIWPFPEVNSNNMSPLLYSNGFGQTWPTYDSWNGRSISVPGGFDGISWGLTYEADSATTTTLTDSSLSWGVDNFYRDFWIVPLSTPNMWQPRKVVNYDGGTKTFTVSHPWDNAWSGDLYYDIVVPSGTEEAFIFERGFAQAGAAGQITLRAAASALDNDYKHGEVILVAGTGAGQKADILTYNGTSKVATTSPPWRVNPDATTIYIVESGATDYTLTQEAVTLSTDVNLDSIIGQILDNGGAWSYDRTLHSLEVVGGGGGGGGSPTVPQITAGLWDAVAASYIDAGSMGELQNLISGGTIAVIQPVLDGGLVEVTIGNDYLTVDGLQFQFLFSTPANLTAATGTMDIYAVNTSTPMLSQAVSVITPTGDPKRVDVDLTRVQTSTFVAPTQYRYVLDFTLASGSEVILVKGRLNAAD